MRVRVDAAGCRRCEVRPPRELERILAAAYGPQTEAVIFRLHRGLQRAGAAIETDNLCLAGIETVLFAIPDPTPLAIARLAKVSELAKWGTAWQDQPRVPAGQPGGGQWTDEDDDDPEPSASPKEPVSTQGPKLPIDDGVYRPATDAPRVVPTGGTEDDAEPRSTDRLSITLVSKTFSPNLRTNPARRLCWRP